MKKIICLIIFLLVGCADNPPESKPSQLILNNSSIPSMPKWIWSERADPGVEFEKFITNNLSKDCRKTTYSSDVSSLFGYKNYWKAENGIAYEIIVRLDKQCFEKLRETIENQKAKSSLVIHDKTPNKLFFNYGADGGPTIIFYFDEKDVDISSIEGSKDYLLPPISDSSNAFSQLTKAANAS
jgi:uncharacterized protein YcfL